MPTPTTQRPAEPAAGTYRAAPPPSRTAPPAWTPSPIDPYGDQRTQPPQAQRAGPQFADAPSSYQDASASLQSQLGADPHGQSLEPVEADGDYDDHYEDEEPPRRSRYALIAASLIGAVALGGGLAYAYKAFVLAPTQVAGTPVVKGGSAPVKVKPVDPGGTKFANADSKMMDSLSGTPSSSAAGSSPPADGGPRAVQTMRVERDGTIAAAAIAPPATGSLPAPPATSPQAAAAALSTSSPVPGMTLVLPPPRVAAPSAGPAPVAQAAAAVAPKIITPKIVAAAPVVTAAAGPTNDAGDPVGSPPAAKKILPPAKKAAAAGLGAGGGANGFVAVLASVPASGTSRTQAMQQFADLQQKYNGVLAGKAPDVVEAKLDKGVYHRLIVGPPASRDSATTLCTQLKAAGYTSDCWVTGF
jgi:hypothetical protein